MSSLSPRDEGGDEETIPTAAAEEYIVAEERAGGEEAENFIEEESSKKTPEEEAALKIQRVVRGRIARFRVRLLLISMQKLLEKRTVVWEWERGKEMGPEIAHAHALAVLQAHKNGGSITSEVQDFIGGFDAPWSLPNTAMAVDYLFYGVTSLPPLKSMIEEGDYLGVVSLLRSDLERHFPEGLQSQSVVDRALHLHNVGFRLAERAALENRPDLAEAVITVTFNSVSGSGLELSAGLALLRVLLKDTLALTLYMRKRIMQALFVIQETVKMSNTLRQAVGQISPSQTYALDDMHSQVLCHCGVILIAMGNYDSALDHFDRAYRMSTSFCDVINSTSSERRRWYDMAGQYQRPETALQFPASSSRRRRGGGGGKHNNDNNNDAFPSTIDEEKEESAVVDGAAKTTTKVGILGQYHFRPEEDQENRKGAKGDKNNKKKTGKNSSKKEKVDFDPSIAAQKQQPQPSSSSSPTTSPGKSKDGSKTLSVKLIAQVEENGGNQKQGEGGDDDNDYLISRSPKLAIAGGLAFPSPKNISAGDNTVLLLDAIALPHEHGTLIEGSAVPVRIVSAGGGSISSGSSLSVSGGGFPSPTFEVAPGSLVSLPPAAEENMTIAPILVDHGENKEENNSNKEAATKQEEEKGEKEKADDKAAKEEEDEDEDEEEEDEDDEGGDESPGQFSPLPPTTASSSQASPYPIGRPVLRMLELPCGPHIRHLSVLLTSLLGVASASLHLHKFDQASDALKVAVVISRGNQLIPKNIAIVVALYAATTAVILKSFPSSSSFAQSKNNNNNSSNNNVTADQSFLSVDSAVSNDRGRTVQSVSFVSPPTSANGNGSARKKKEKKQFSSTTTAGETKLPQIFASSSTLTKMNASIMLSESFQQFRESKYVGIQRPITRTTMLYGESRAKPCEWKLEIDRFLKSPLIASPEPANSILNDKRIATYLENQELLVAEQKRRARFMNSIRLPRLSRSPFGDLEQQDQQGPMMEASPLPSAAMNVQQQQQNMKRARSLPPMAAGKTSPSPTFGNSSSVLSKSGGPRSTRVVAPSPTGGVDAATSTATDPSEDAVAKQEEIEEEKATREVAVEEEEAVEEAPKEAPEEKSEQEVKVDKKEEEEEKEEQVAEAVVAAVAAAVDEEEMDRQVKAINEGSSASAATEVKKEDGNNNNAGSTPAKRTKPSYASPIPSRSRVPLTSRSAEKKKEADEAAAAASAKKKRVPVKQYTRPPPAAEGEKKEEQQETSPPPPKSAPQVATVKKQQPAARVTPSPPPPATRSSADAKKTSSPAKQRPAAMKNTTTTSNKDKEKTPAAAAAAVVVKNNNSSSKQVVKEEEKKKVEGQDDKKAQDTEGTENKEQQKETSETVVVDDAKASAAVKIQSLARGKAARNQTKGMQKEESKKSETATATATTAPPAAKPQQQPQHDVAAVKIQSLARGNLARKQTKLKKTGAEEAKAATTEPAVEEKKKEEEDGAAKKDEQTIDAVKVEGEQETKEGEQNDVAVAPPPPQAEASAPAEKDSDVPPPPPAPIDEDKTDSEAPVHVPIAAEAVQSTESIPEEKIE